MKQPDMFHKYDLSGCACDDDNDIDDNDVDDDINDDDPVGPVIVDIQKQQAKTVEYPNLRRDSLEFCKFKVRLHLNYKYLITDLVFNPSGRF